MPITQKQRTDIEADLLKKRRLTEERKALKQEIERIKKLARDELTRLERIERDYLNDIKSLSMLCISVKNGTSKTAVCEVSNKLSYNEPCINLSDHLSKQG